MWSQREMVEYGLQRRQTILTVLNPARFLDSHDARDADPLLMRAALHHGEFQPTPCPLCPAAHLVTLNYVFGDQLGQYSGRIKSTRELEQMENEFGEFKVVVVEICTRCGWNHMIQSYLLGDGQKRRPPRRQQTVEDIYG